MMDLPCEMLLHPELLSNEQLMYIIHERQLKVPDLHNMPRDQLLELFHHYCVPFGQRKYRDSGRGKILNRTRHMSPEAKPKLNVISAGGAPGRRPHSWGTERMKPPPDLLSGHMKRIKLENKSVPIIRESNGCKRKMSVDFDSPGVDSPSKRERKPITWP